MPFVVAGLVLSGANDVWLLAASWHRATYSHRIADGSLEFSLPSARAVDHDVRIASIAAGAAVLITGVLFITWLYRLVKDIDRWRPGVLAHRPGWAIGGWFVPVLTWFRPKQMVDDGWRASSPPGEWAYTVPWWINAWWASYLVAGFTLFIGRAINRDTFSGLATSDRVVAVGCAMYVVAAAFATATVVSLTNRVRAQPEIEHRAAGYRFNPPPGWPVPPAGWAPSPGWQPDPQWPPAPADWNFWTPAETVDGRAEPSPSVRRGSTWPDDG
jgi:hypothetical protein